MPPLVDHYRFGEFSFDPQTYLLYKNGETLKVSARTGEVLLMLLSRYGKVVSKEELLSEIWKGSFVEEGILTVHVSHLRKALGDDRQAPRFIETVPKRGYRFVHQVEWVEAESLAGEHESEAENRRHPTDESVRRTGRRRSYSRIASVIGLSVVLLAVSALMMRNWRPPSSAFKNADVTRLVNTDGSRLIAISPNGELIAHVITSGQQQQLTIRERTATTDRQLPTPAVTSFRSIAFADDGRSIFFVGGTGGDRQLKLYRLDPTGGEPELLWEGVEGTVSFAPGGRRFAFVRTLEATTTALRTEPKHTALVVADLDQQKERIAAERRSPEYFSANAVAWQPTGENVTVGLLNLDPSVMGALINVNASDGQEELFQRGWSNLGKLQWNSGGDTLYVAGARKPGAEQLWMVAKDSDPLKLTSDLKGFREISVSRDERFLATILMEDRYSVWSGSLSGLDQAQLVAGDEEHTFQRIAIAPDGKIVFPSYATGDRELWVMNSDGSGVQQITRDGASNMLPTWCDGNRYIVFTSNRGGKNSNIWRINSDGSDPIRLSSGEQDFGASCTPDGRSILYMTKIHGVGGLWQVPVDGGEPISVFVHATSAADFNPKGDMVAFWTALEKDSAPLLAVHRWPGGDEIAKFKSAPDSSHPPRWTTDGTALLYVSTQNGVSNIWSQFIKGGEPMKLSNFISEMIVGLDVSTDGRLFMVRGNSYRGGALISVNRQS